VKPAIAIVRRDRASGKDSRLCGGTLAKQEQDLAAWHVQRPERRVLEVPDERSEPKNTLIEFA
jgi:hypothetical protein